MDPPSPDVPDPLPRPGRRGSRAGRLAAMSCLGFSSGLPLALTGATLLVRVTESGADLGSVGLFSAVALPYALKFLWAPLLDRFSLPFLGRRRGWLLAAQAALAAAIGACAFAEPSASLPAFALVALLTAFVSATQDVVVDAWRAESFDEREVGHAAALGVTGYRVGTLATGAGLMWLVGAAGWSWRDAWLLAAAGVGVGALGTLLAPEPARTSAPSTLRDAVVLPFREFLGRRGAWAVLAFILVFRLPDVAAGTMTPSFLLRHGYAKEEIAALQQGLGIAVTIAGTLAGGALVARRGLLRSLWVLGVLQAASNLAFAALALVPARLDALAGAVLVENFCAGLVTAGFVGFLTAQCDPRHAAAQYALLSSLMAAFRLVGAPAGYAAAAFGWPAFFVLTAVLGLPGLALLSRLGTRSTPPPAAVEAPRPVAAPPLPGDGTAAAATGLR